MIKFVNEMPCEDRIWLLTIRHTGTNFTYKHLGILGYDRCTIHWPDMRILLPTGPKQFIHTHIGFIPEWNVITDEKVVVTLRNPIDVFKTHVYRYDWNINEFSPCIIQMFKDWCLLVNRFSAHIFRVDAEDQEAEVNELSKFLNAVSWTYKEQQRNISSCFVPDFFRDDKKAKMLYDNPPQEIFELANEYGY